MNTMTKSNKTEAKASTIGKYVASNSANGRLALAHAYNIVAMMNGYNDWMTMKGAALKPKKDDTSKNTQQNVSQIINTTEISDIVSAISMNKDKNIIIIDKTGGGGKYLVKEYLELLGVPCMRLPEDGVTCLFGDKSRIKLITNEAQLNNELQLLEEKKDQIVKPLTTATSNKISDSLDSFTSLDVRRDKIYNISSAAHQLTLDAYSALLVWLRDIKNAPLNLESFKNKIDVTTLIDVAISEQFVKPEYAGVPLAVKERISDYLCRLPKLSQKILKIIPAKHPFSEGNYELDLSATVRQYHGYEISVLEWLMQSILKSNGTLIKEHISDYGLLKGGQFNEDTPIFQTASASEIASICENLLPKYDADREFYKQRSLRFFLKVLKVLIWLRDTKDIPITINSIIKSISLPEIVKMACPDQFAPDIYKNMPPDVKDSVFRYCRSLPGLSQDVLQTTEDELAKHPLSDKNYKIQIHDETISFHEYIKTLVDKQIDEIQSLFGSDLSYKIHDETLVLILSQA